MNYGESLREGKYFEHQMWTQEDASRKEYYEGFTKGIESDDRRRKIENLLSNMENETIKAEAGELTKAGLTTKDDLKQNLALQRPLFDKLISDELVSIQPMNKATGYVFSLDWKRYIDGTSDTSITTHDNDFSDNATELSDVASIYLDITKTLIEAKAKKLKAKASIEVLQDLNSEHGLAGENALLEGISRVMASEINGEIITDMFTQAATTVLWSQNAPAGDVSTYEKRAYRQTLGDAVVDANNAIFKAIKSEASFIVGNADAIAHFEKMVNHGFERTTADTGMVGIQKVGTFDGRYKVFKTEYAPANKILVGFKGADWLDASYVYAPYMLGWLSPPIYLETVGWVRAAMSRFAKTALRSGNGLAVIEITNS